MFYIKLSWRIFSHKYWICCFVIFTKQQFFAAVKEIHKLQFWSSSTSADTKLLLPKPSNHWNMEHYQGSVNCGELDLELDVNSLDSGNCRQYNTVTFSVSYCPGPERGILFILIIDTISRSALVLIILLHAINYHYNKGPLKVEFFSYKMIHSGLLHIDILQSILIGWVIKFYSFILFWYTHEAVHLLILSIGLWRFYYFDYFLY